MSVSNCCITGFEWNGTPTGQTETISGTTIPAYVSGDNANAAVLIVHDLLGWTFPNARLLADHYAREANVTVYVPDFFAGEVIPFEPILAGRYHEVDIPGFLSRNSRDIREPAIVQYAQVLRGKYAKLGVVGFCYGGWAGFRLGAMKTDGKKLVDCVAVGHPSLLTKEDIDGVDAPVLVLAAEKDPVYTAELKGYTFEAFQKNGVPFDYQHFPDVEHGCLVRGDEKIAGERDAMVRGKNSIVAWVNQFLGTG